MTHNNQTFIDAWFTTHGAHDEENPAIPSEAQSLKAYLFPPETINRTSSSSSSARDTAKELLSNTSTGSSEGSASHPVASDDDDKTHRTAVLLLDAAMEFRKQQGEILDLVDAVRETQGDVGKEVVRELEEEEDRLYRSLEAYKSSLPTQIYPSPEDFQRLYISATSFQAHQMLRRFPPPQVIPFGVEKIIDALEREPLSDNENGKVRGGISKADYLNISLPSACQYLILTTPRIYECVGNDDAWKGELPALASDIFPSSSSPPSSSDGGNDEKRKTTKGLTRARWEFWKQRLAWMISQEEEEDDDDDSLSVVNEGAKAEARRALELIEGVI